jgi:hypothetical protein
MEEKHEKRGHRFIQTFAFMKNTNEILCNAYVTLCFIQFVGLYGELWTWGPLVFVPRKMDFSLF